MITMCRPIIITTRKTIESELEEFGIPDGRMDGFIAFSDSGYIKGDQFEKFLTPCALPSLLEKRKAMGKSRVSYSMSTALTVMKMY